MGKSYGHIKYSKVKHFGAMVELLDKYWTWKILMFEDGKCNGCQQKQQDWTWIRTFFINVGWFE